MSPMLPDDRYAEVVRLFEEVGELEAQYREGLERLILEKMIDQAIARLRDT